MKIILRLIALSLFVSLISSECGYNACHKTDNKKLNIHLIPHSHDDVGWMTTPDGYYESVRQIITNVVKSLEANASRRFIQVEQYFFHRWWTEQNAATQAAVKKLVENGQLAFVNGGWTVNDEGAAHYNNIIDQMTLGHRFLDDTFGKCGHPKTSWQIDPFGASKENPSLNALMGFDGHVLNRGPNPKGEYILNASPDLKTQIFTTVLHDHYSAPNGFNFDGNNNNINDSNAQSKSDAFVNIAKSWNTNYGNTNQVLVTMGDDFQYNHAENWFSNMDRLITEIKKRHTDVDIFYSTPDCYVLAVNGIGKTFSERDVDYLHYWVGYYSNRPALKYQDRVTNNILQAGKQLDVLSRVDPQKTKANLDEARNEVAILTHHDAITGTSPQATADDYTKRLQKGYSAAVNVIQNAYYNLKNNKKSLTSDTFCDALNVTQCGVTESNGKVAVTIYNPIGRPVSSHIKVPVPSTNYEVYDASGAKVSHAVLPVPDAVKRLPDRKSSSANELSFKANLPALGYTTYFVEKQNGLQMPKEVHLERQKRATTQLKGKSFTLDVDSTSGALVSITTNGKTHQLRQSFKYYTSAAHVSGEEDSGSYNFCPNGEAHDLGAQKLLNTHTNGGVHEVNQQFGDYVSQTVRTYEDEDYIEFDWTVGPIPHDIGREVITRFDTDLKTNGVFYTDSNGRQTMKRKYDPNYKICGNDVVAGNWYPIYTRAYIRDEAQGVQLSVLNDRTQGGTSLKDGSLELMVHRRLVQKGNGGDFVINEGGVDGKGLIVRGKHYIYVKPIAESIQSAKGLAEELFLAPIVSFEKYDSTFKDYSNTKVVTFSGLNKALPENVHLLTLENWKTNQVLLRLEHFYESSDSGSLSKAVTVSLDNLFKTFKITDAVETTLTANEPLSELKRLKWNGKYFSNEVQNRTKRAFNPSVTLNPQQIRTFILTVQ